MALTKTQINYLERKLERIMSEKITKYRKEIGASVRTTELLKDRLNQGVINLISNEEIKEILVKKLEECGYYEPSIHLNELVPKHMYEAVKDEVQNKTDLVNQYTDKLNKIKEKALDSFVLKGVDIETVLAEFEEV